MREEIIRFIKTEYGVNEEYMWIKHPSFAVFRNAKNKKWFAVIMQVPEKSLGIKGNNVREILNLKCTPELTSTLISVKGILPAYHMNKEHWISLLLDQVDKQFVFSLIDESYNLIDKPQIKKNR